MLDEQVSNNGWLGIASISVNGSHITQGTVKLNDTYFNQAAEVDLLPDQDCPRGTSETARPSRFEACYGCAWISVAKGGRLPLRVLAVTSTASP